MASCITAIWSGTTAPQARLTVTQKSETGDTATLSWKLEYVAHGYAARTNNIGRAYTVKIDGDIPSGGSGTFNIHGITGTKEVASGTVTIDKEHSAQTIAFSVSFEFNLTWSDVYKGTATASGSISVKAKTSYTFTYNANGGTGAPANQTKWHGEDLTISSTKPTRTGYSFQGWSETQNGTKLYDAGGTSRANEDLTLWAIWKANTYSVKYNANGGSGAPSAQTKTYGVELTLSSTKPTRTGYSFQGWSTSSSATTATYQAGSKYTTNSGTTLYAVWKANTYSVKYNANGGTGAPSTQTKTYGVTLKLSSVEPTRENYNFLGWSTSASATTATYQAGSNYTANSGTTLYAVWQLAYTRPRINSLIAARAKLIENDDGTSSYETSEEGTYALVTLDYACDKSLKEIKIECRYGNSTIDSMLISGGATSETLTDMVMGDGDLNPELTYTIRVTVTDEVDYNTAFYTLSGMNLPFDVKINDETGPEGISFGKPAELTGKADFNYEIYPRKGFSNILLEPETDLNTVMTPNTYIGENTSTYNYANCPITSGTFTLEVAAGGDDGQRVQTLTVCNKTNFTIWKRFYHADASGVKDWAKDSNGNYIWTKEFSAGGTLMAIPGYFMTGSHVVNFVERTGQKVSMQPNGIVLVFSAYASGSVQNYAWNSFFIPKYLVNNHNGSGSSFLLTDATTAIATKYLYIYDDRIEGHDSNGGTHTANGITYNNSYFVLRYVIGV